MMPTLKVLVASALCSERQSIANATAPLVFLFLWVRFFFFAPTQRKRKEQGEHKQN